MELNCEMNVTALLTLVLLAWVVGVVELLLTWDESNKKGRIASATSP